MSVDFGIRMIQSSQLTVPVKDQVNATNIPETCSLVLEAMVMETEHILYFNTAFSDNVPLMNIGYEHPPDEVK